MHMVTQCVMLLWSYFACVSADPGRVPEGASAQLIIWTCVSLDMISCSNVAFVQMCRSQWLMANMPAGWAPYADEVDMAAAEQLVRMGGGTRNDAHLDFRRPRWCKKCQVMHRGFPLLLGVNPVALSVEKMWGKCKFERDHVGLT